MLIMKTSLVSIIIPTFNSEKFILEAIQSVQNQTYENWELILVDDCSSDNTVAIILEMVEKMIDTFFQLEKIVALVLPEIKVMQVVGTYLFRCR
jgi:glycosyltransferase involved in cell wall biosynthesis